MAFQIAARINSSFQEDDSYGSAFVGRFLENGSYVFQSGYVLNPLADFQTMLNFT